MVLGAAKALHALAVGAAAGIDIFGDRGRADKADGHDLGMIEDRVNRALVTIDHLKDAIRRAGFAHQFSQHQRHGRVTFRRLEDEGIAGSNRRAELPHRNHRREIERGDAGHHAKRLAQRIHVDAGTGALGEFTLEQMRRAEAEFRHFQPADDVALGVGNGLAVFAGQRLGQLVHVTVQQFDELHQHPRALLRIGGGPAGLRLGSDGDRFGHFLG